MENEQKTSDAARALGRRGASKGGIARAAKLSPEQRSEIARRAALERWGSEDEVQRATHLGVLPLADIPCAVLEDGTRVLSERGVVKAMGGKRGGSHWRRRKEGGGADLPIYLSAKNLKPFIDDDLAAALTRPILYRPASGGGTPANGIPATLLPEVCNVWLSARDAGKLVGRQKAMAHQADLIVRALAHVGIVALVDEATGYQADRPRDDMARILQAFIAKELRKWVKTFPNEFYREMFRLRGWNYSDLSSARPQVVGHFTNDIVFDRLAPGLREELNRLTPRDEKGRLKNHLHSWLSDRTGHPRLREHLAAVVALMKASSTWEGFMRALDRAFPRYGDTMPIPFKEDI